VTDKVLKTMDQASFQSSRAGDSPLADAAAAAGSLDIANKLKNMW